MPKYFSIISTPRALKLKKSSEKGLIGVARCKKVLLDAHITFEYPLQFCIIQLSVRIRFWEVMHRFLDSKVDRLFGLTNYFLKVVLTAYENRN